MLPDKKPNRRTVISAILTAPFVLAGCIGDDDEAFRLDPDEFEDEYLHLVAEGVDRTSLDLVRLIREDTWIAVELHYDGVLREHLQPLPDDIDVPTPIPPEVVEMYIRPPEFEMIVEWYIDAVNAGEDGDGLRLHYSDGTCTSSVGLPRNRVDWYLDETLSLQDIHTDLRSRYVLNC